MPVQKTKSVNRTKPIETLISLMIMGLLVTISIVLYKAQERLNPAVINFGSVGDEKRVSFAGTDDQPIISIPESLQAMSSPERFDPATLSNKINGKAELYLSAGFVELRTQRFQRIDKETGWFELYLYNMGTPSNAFAVFSAQRRKDVQKLPLSQYAYGTANAIFFTTGPYYVEMIAATSGPAITTMLTDAARQVLDQQEEDANQYEKAIGPERLFPINDLVADSITLIAKDAFGFSRLDQVYTARFRTAETETTLFVSPRVSPQEAATLAAAYQDFLVEFGGTMVMPSPESIFEGISILDILDSYELLFSKGAFFAGVHMAEDKGAAIEQAKRLYRHLERLPSPLPNKEVISK